MSKTFTGAEFLKALAEGSLSDPIVKQGLVKPAENDPDSLMFSEGTSCLHWTKVPSSMIEKVEYIRTVGCQDHSHPFVRLYLKEPAATNKEAAVFAEVLKSAGSGQASAAPMRVGKPGPMSMKAGRQFRAVRSPSLRAARRCDEYYVDAWVHCNDGPWREVRGFGSTCSDAEDDTQAKGVQACEYDGGVDRYEDASECLCWR